VGWQKKGVGHEVFLTEKGGHLKILVQKGGSSYLLSGIIMEKNLTCIMIIATTGSEQGSKFNSCIASKSILIKR
jgi:hypothetical protein